MLRLHQRPILSPNTPPISLFSFLPFLFCIPSFFPLLPLCTGTIIIVYCISPSCLTSSPFALPFSSFSLSFSKSFLPSDSSFLTSPHIPFLFSLPLFLLPPLCFCIAVPPALISSSSLPPVHLRSDFSSCLTFLLPPTLIFSSLFLPPSPSLSSICQCDLSCLYFLPSFVSVFLPLLSAVHSTLHPPFLSLLHSLLLISDKDLFPLHPFLHLVRTITNDFCLFFHFSGCCRMVGRHFGSIALFLLLFVLFLLFHLHHFWLCYS